MKRLLLVFLLASVSQLTFASCAIGQFKTLSETLFQKQFIPFTNIFTCRPISRRVESSSNPDVMINVSKVEIINNYFGTTDSNIIEIYSCVHSECPCGLSPDSGNQYLLFVSFWNGHYASDYQWSTAMKWRKTRDQWIDMQKAKEEIALVEKFVDIFKNKASGHYIFRDLQDSIVADGWFSDGVATGLWHHYYDNGAIKAEYDLEHNIVNQYNLNGSVNYKTYKQGKINVRQDFGYNSKGGLGFQSKEIKDDTVSTYWRCEYYSNGNKKQESTSLDEKPVGKNYFISLGYAGFYEEFYENGKPKIKGHYDKNKKVGTWYSFTETGALSNKMIYKDGNRVK